jgi:sugar phosphate isomerase/epimerase
MSATSPLPFACLTTCVPGRSLAEQCAQIAAAGCMGVETIVFPDTPLEPWQHDLQQSAGVNGLQVVAVILGGLALYRSGQLSWIKEALAAIAEIGAAALITPEYRAQDPLPLFPPYAAPPLAEQRQVMDNVTAMSEVARTRSMSLWLEPITQFESRFWREVDPVLALCEQLANPYMGLALDFHNMNITERDIHATLQRSRAWLRHIHLADNNRRLPGQGHIDFGAALATLHQIGYRGWYSFECGGFGDFVTEVRQAIAQLASLSHTLS